MIALNEKIRSEDMNISNFLADPAISGIVLRPDTGGGSEVDPHLPAEEFNISDRTKVLLLNGRLDQANYDLVQSKIQEYKEAKLNDVSNGKKKARLHRAHKQTLQAIAQVADQGVKAALQKIHAEIHILEE